MPTEEPPTPFHEMSPFAPIVSTPGKPLPPAPLPPEDAVEGYEFEGFRDESTMHVSELARNVRK